MANGDVIAKNQRIFITHHVQYAAVLNVAARPDANVVHVAANHRTRPDARILANDHVADNNSSRVNISRSRDLRMLAAIRPDVGLASHRYWLEGESGQAEV